MVNDSFSPYERAQKQSYVQKTALERWRDGERSVQVIAELSAHFVRVCETRRERSNQLEAWHTDDIYVRYRQLNLPIGDIVTWRKRILKITMIAPIVDAEYPTEEYEQALKEAGVSPETIFHYSERHISSKHL